MTFWPGLGGPLKSVPALLSSPSTCHFLPCRYTRWPGALSPAKVKGKAQPHFGIPRMGVLPPLGGSLEIEWSQDDNWHPWPEPSRDTGNSVLLLKVKDLWGCLMPLNPSPMWFSHPRGYKAQGSISSTGTVEWGGGRRVHVILQ